MGRIDTASNDPHEAYTGNSMGRKEDRIFLKQFSLVIAGAGGDDVKKSEANTKGSTTCLCGACSDIASKARSWRACRGQRAWHVEREASGTWETLAFPVGSGRAFQLNEESPMGVRESDRLIVL